MFRIDMQRAAEHLLIRVEGKLAGAYAEHARSMIGECQGGRTVVELNDLTSIDAQGEEVLLLLKSRGAKFIAEDVYSRYLCERLRLPLVHTKSRKARQ